MDHLGMPTQGEFPTSKLAGAKIDDDSLKSLDQYVSSVKVTVIYIDRLGIPQAPRDAAPEH
jgi:hypothetical protein